jgi:hypothetical protein
VASPYATPLALIGLIGFVAFIPAWLWFLQDRSAGLPLEVQVLAGMALPALAILFLVSWLQPGGA